MKITCNNCHSTKIGVSFEFHLSTEELHVRATNWLLLHFFLRQSRTQIINALLAAGGTRFLAKLCIIHKVFAPAYRHQAMTSNLYTKQNYFDEGILDFTLRWLDITFLLCCGSCRGSALKSKHIQAVHCFPNRILLAA